MRVTIGMVQVGLVSGGHRGVGIGVIDLVRCPPDEHLVTLAAKFRHSVLPAPLDGR